MWRKKCYNNLEIYSQAVVIWKIHLFTKRIKKNTGNQSKEFYRKIRINLSLRAFHIQNCCIVGPLQWLYWWKIYSQIFPWFILLICQSNREMFIRAGVLNIENDKYFLTQEGQNLIDKYTEIINNQQSSGGLFQYREKEKSLMFPYIARWIIRVMQD